ncbi:lasso RiPP family leader peptide-containing protein [Erythrobacter insulae]|nr:lasso RiPP family leader peptide-containing protein [Erythrobacter insulae]
MQKKTTYASPKLTDYGSVRNLTGGSVGGTNDSGGSLDGGKSTMM